MNTIFRVRELRLARGITQAQLANLLTLKSPSTVTMWESGARNPTSDILPHLAKALGCSVDDLYISTPQDISSKNG